MRWPELDRRMTPSLSAIGKHATNFDLYFYSTTMSKTKLKGPRHMVVVNRTSRRMNRIAFVVPSGKVDLPLP